MQRGTPTVLVVCAVGAEHRQAEGWLAHAALAWRRVPDMRLALAHTQLQSVGLAQLKVAVNDPLNFTWQSL
jgi:hypothetical protein